MLVPEENETKEQFVERIYESILAYKPSCDDPSSSAPIPDHIALALARIAVEGDIGAHGHFIYHLLQNHLVEAISYADSNNKAAIFVLVKWLYNQAPRGMWASSSNRDIDDWRGLWDMYHRRSY